MGLKYAVKRAIMRGAMKKHKREAGATPEEVDLYELPADADKFLSSSYYFSAHAPGGASFLFRIAYRGEGGAEMWLAYLGADGEAYLNTEPLTTRAACPGRVECVVPGNDWKFTFSGEVFPVKPGKNLVAAPCGKAVRADFKGEFKGGRPAFELTRDCDTRSLADALAAEKWGKGFSDVVRANHQAHIEQFGRVKGVLTVNGKTIKIDSHAVRDRSNGRRVWADMNRHGWFGVITGDGALYNVSTVRYPALNVKGITAGYKASDKGTVPVSAADFPSGFGRSGGVPPRASFSARFSDKSTAEIAYEAKIVFPFRYEDGAYTLYEGVADFTVDGARARGIAELGYNGDPKRYA